MLKKPYSKLKFNRYKLADSLFFLIILTINIGFSISIFGRYELGMFLIIIFFFILTILIFSEKNNNLRFNIKYITQNFAIKPIYLRISILIYFLSVIISVIYSRQWGSFEYLISHSIGLSLCLFIYYLSNEARIYRYVNYLIIILFIISLLGIYEYYFPNSFYQLLKIISNQEKIVISIKHWLLDLGRITSTWLHASFFGLITSIGFTLSFIRIEFKLPNQFLKELIYYLLSFTFVFANILANTRSSSLLLLLSFIFIFLIIFFYKKDYNLIWRFITILLIIAFCVFLQKIPHKFIIKDFQYSNDRMINLQEAEENKNLEELKTLSNTKFDNNYNIIDRFLGKDRFSNKFFAPRIKLYKISLEQFKKSPILGTGIKSMRNLNIKNANDSHNIFIQHLVENGIIGFFSLSLIIISFIMSYFSILKKIKESSNRRFQIIALVIIFSLFLFIVDSLVNNPLYNWRLILLFWILQGIILSIDKVTIKS